MGVLYDSKPIQVGYKAQFENGYTGKLVLYYVNRMSLPFTGVHATLPDTESLKVQARPDTPFEVGAGSQVMHYFLWICRRPFLEPPVVTVNFTYDGIAQSIPLKVPLLLTSFCLPTPLPAADFIATWTKTANELMQTHKLPGPADVNDLKTVIAKYLHLANIDGAEKSPDNIVASGTFHTATKDPSGNLVSMACLLRVETRPGVNAVRVTVRSGHAQVSTSLMHAVSSVFGASE